VLLNAIPL